MLKMRYKIYTHYVDDNWRKQLKLEKILNRRMGESLHAFALRAAEKVLGVKPDNIERGLQGSTPEAYRRFAPIKNGMHLKNIYLYRTGE